MTSTPQRARDDARAKPLLLIIGGPGAAFGRTPELFAAWEIRFTLVHWEQPYEGPLTLGGLAKTAAEVAAEACRVSERTRLAVLGMSGGSVVGLRLARDRPDLVGAYVGTGQFVHWGRQVGLGYRMALDRARARGDADAAADLQRLGPPPYPDILGDAALSRYIGALTPREAEGLPGFDPAWGVEARRRGGLAFAAVRDELQAFDAWSLGTRFEVPIWFLQGEDDLYSVTSEVESYAAAIEAPARGVDILPGGGHAAFLLGAPFADALALRLRPG